MTTRRRVDRHPLAGTLVDRRVYLGIKRDRLAERLGVSLSKLVDLERGTASPSLEFLTLWARALKYEPYLVDLKPIFVSWDHEREWIKRERERV